MSACPISCGLCCEDVIAKRRCPHLGPHGCLLPRDDRPTGCQLYLCGIAKACDEGLLSVDDARRLKQWDREQEQLKTEVH